VIRLWAGRPGFDSQQRQGSFLFATASRPTLGHTKLPVQCLTGGFFPGANRPGNEADHSLPSSGEVKNAWSYTSPPHTSSLYGGSDSVCRSCYALYSVRSPSNQDAETNGEGFDIGQKLC